MLEIKQKQNNKNIKITLDEIRSRGFVTLNEATKFCNYTQEYLSLLARRGELKSEKIGRNWYTKVKWLREYVETHLPENSINGKGEFFVPAEKKEIKFLSSLRSFFSLIESKKNMLSFVTILLLMVSFFVCLEGKWKLSLFNNKTEKVAEVIDGEKQDLFWLKNLSEEVSEKIVLGKNRGYVAGAKIAVNPLPQTDSFSNIKNWWQNLFNKTKDKTFNFLSYIAGNNLLAKDNQKQNVIALNLSINKTVQQPIIENIQSDNDKEIVYIKGEAGEKGEKGDKGETGSAGPVGENSVGTTVVNNIYTIAPGGTATNGSGTSLATKYIGAGELSVSGNTNLVGTLIIQGGASFNSTVNIAGLLTGDEVIFNSLRSSVVNATTTNVENLTAQEICLNGSCQTSWPSGSSAGGSNWEEIFNNTLSPTSSVTGIFIKASSTIDSNLRVSGKLAIATSTPYENYGLAVATSTIIVTDTFERPRFVIGSSTATNLYVASNGTVGIGKNNPSSVYALDVAGAIKTSTYLEASSAVVYGSAGLYMSGSNRGAYSFDTITTGGSYPLNLYSGNGISTFGGYVAISANGTEAMRIASSSAIGIATTTPGGYFGEKLTVVGGAYIQGNATTTNLVAGDILYVKDGKVSIGYQPMSSYELTVHGTSVFYPNNTSNVIYITNDTATTKAAIQAGSDYFAITGNNDADVYLRNDSYQGIVIKDSGYMGVYNTNPQYKLDVAGDINLNATSSIYMKGLKVFNASSTTYSLSMGTSAGNSLNDGGLYNVFAGYQAGYNATSSDYNTGIGYSSLYSVVNSDGNGGKYNTAIGSEALYANTTGYQNLGLGYYALHDNTTGASNFGLGFKALRYNTVGSSNVAIGNNSLYSNQTADFNTAVGHATLYNNASGASNVALGYNALYKNITGTGNIAIGHNAGYYNNSATSSVIIGHNAAWGNANYSNKELTVIGYQAGYNMDTGSDANTFLGYQTGYTLTTASNNTLIGYKAGYAINSGANNILLGYKAGDALTTGTKNIVIGYDIDAPAVDSTNILNIGNILFGTGLTGSGTNIAGSIGIATSTPGGTYGEKLTVVGDTYIQGNATTTHLAVTELCLGGDCRTVWPTSSGTTGAPGAWENIWTNTITPTSSATGIFVRASSTIDANFRVTGNATTTGNLDISGQLALNGAVNASDKIINTTGGNATDSYIYSVYNNLRSGKSGQALYGAYNVLTSDNISVNMYGTYNTGSMTGNNGGQVLYGSYTTLLASATGAQIYGSYTSLTSNQSASQTLYGNYVTLQTDSSGAFMDSAYGYYVVDTGTASTGGTQYGLYVDVDDANVTNYSVYVNEGSGISYFGSAVGVGTTTPYANLTVVNDSYTLPKFMVASSTGFSTPSLYVASNGNVAIATTTPGGYYNEKLTVVGNTYLQGNATSTGAQYLGGDLTVGGRHVALFKNGTTPLKIRNNGTDSNIIENGANGGYLALGADPSTYSLVIDYNERVGIGTVGDTIDAKLELMGSGIPQLLINNNNDTQWSFYSGYQSIGGNLTINRSGASGNFVLGNAGLGIGAPHTTGLLQVGTSTIVTNATSTATMVGIGTATPTSTLAVAGTFNVQDQSAKTSYLTVTTAGNVGVATSTPWEGMKLAVDGSILLTGDIYKNGSAYGNPDYVFAKYFGNDIGSMETVPEDYEMLSLDELELYLKDNHHLPGIQLTDPLPLFERNRLQLEKIEEMSLYILELNKRVKDLEVVNLTENGEVDIPVVASGSQFINLEVRGETVFAGQVLFKAETIFNSDMAGRAKILAGTTTVEVVFDHEYETEPIVTITPLGLIGVDYGVATTTAKGFYIVIDQVLDHEVIFNWHSLFVEKPKLFVSDKTVEEIILVPEENIEENVEQFGTGQVDTSGSTETVESNDNAVEQQGQETEGQVAGETTTDQETPVNQVLESNQPVIENVNTVEQTNSELDNNVEVVGEQESEVGAQPTVVEVVTPEVNVE